MAVVYRSSDGLPVLCETNVKRPYTLSGGRVVWAAAMWGCKRPGGPSTWVVALLSLPLLAMGMLGGGSGGTPERNYRGAFVDRDGTRVEASWIQAGGELALARELGRGTLRVSFDDIRTIELSGGGREPLVARVTPRQGDAFDLEVRNSLSFQGRTSLGVYQVRARDLKTVELETH